jgi:hypothetical protein
MNREIKVKYGNLLDKKLTGFIHVFCITLGLQLTDLSQANISDKAGKWKIFLLL